MLTPEKVVVKDAYQLCNKCGTLLGAGTKAWVLVNVFLCCMCYSDGKYTTPWNQALKTNNLEEGTPEYFNAVAELYTHYQRECQYTPAQAYVDEDFDDCEPYEAEEPREAAHKVSQDKMLGFFFDANFRAQTLEQVEMEHRVCNWERVHGKSAYCLGRTLGEIEEEIESRRTNGAA